MAGCIGAIGATPLEAILAVGRIPWRLRAGSAPPGSEPPPARDFCPFLEAALREARAMRSGLEAVILPAACDWTLKAAERPELAGGVPILTWDPRSDPRGRALLHALGRWADWPITERRLVRARARLAQALEPAGELVRWRARIAGDGLGRRIDGAIDRFGRGGLDAWAASARALAEEARRAPRDGGSGPRVALVGAAHFDPGGAVVRLIEEAGAHAVFQDRGARLAAAGAGIQGDPCPFVPDRIEPLVRLLGELEASGAIVLALKGCPASGAAAADLPAALREAGLAALRVEVGDRTRPIEALGTRVEAFVEILTRKAVREEIA